ncbi:MAG: hypothetical protein IT382_21970 [Deltaproteobacteria bacterium]|nr:hypothetical protein [Deltaproteobacteria bacterium]
MTLLKALLCMLSPGLLALLIACPDGDSVGDAGEGEAETPCEGWPALTWDFPDEQCTQQVSDSWRTFTMNDGAVVVRTLGTRVGYEEDETALTIPHGLSIEGCGLRICAHQPDDPSATAGVVVDNPPLSVTSSHHGFADVWTVTLPTHRVSVMNSYWYEPCEDPTQWIEIVDLDGGEVFETTRHDLPPGCE